MSSQSSSAKVRKVHNGADKSERKIRPFVL